ncbi:MAG: ATP-binding protein [Pyrinomonadaceae bacterium]|nr:ATP-binding protein [Pyrinomonadaceae bacterium]
MREIHSVEISEEAHVGAARRVVHSFANRLGFDETKLAELDIVVQEIATNAVRYATGGGSIHFTTTLEGAPRGIELFYADKGPGIYNVERATSDGATTGGGLGVGFGAIRRLLDEFEIYSSVRSTARLALTRTRRTMHGTAILGRKWTDAADTELKTVAAKRIGVWSRPIPGEDANGDAYLMCKHRQRRLFAVVDGLGHGWGAREAAQAALASLKRWRGEPLNELIFATHDALRATRGAVMGVCVINSEENSFEYAGVGNVLVRVLNSPQPLHPVSTNGTLGLRLPERIHVLTGKWTDGATVVMASDGLSQTWDIGDYPGLLGKEGQMIAGVLMRDYGRDSDDATVLVAR